MVDETLRRLTPQVIGALARRHTDFGAVEDATQEALLAAAVQWREHGVPQSPRGWLVRVADRRLTDMMRSDSPRRRREENVAAAATSGRMFEPAADEESAGDHDDALALLFLCCHPDLPAASQVALTLRAVGGLTTAEIAAAFLVPESTMAQRISRAKRRLRDSGARFQVPAERRLHDRLPAVLQVLYLVFNEGYTSTVGADLQRPDLTAEAIRLTRDLYARLPVDGEVAGLLALMLLTEARHAARTDAQGRLVPLTEQDRSLWDQPLISEGCRLVAAALSRSRTGPGPYQLQAAIAAVHAEARAAEDTDWPQILLLYQLLERIWPTPMVMLNGAVALAMVRGPGAGLSRLDTLQDTEPLRGHHRLHAVRAHLLEAEGNHPAAREAYVRAARLTTSSPEQEYLHAQADRLS